MSTAETRLIPLSQGKFAIVDAEDYPELAQVKWYAYRDWRTHYAVRSVRSPDGTSRMTSRMHRVIMNAPPGMQVDHINGDGLDNRKANLRLCVNAQNRRNRRTQAGSSRYKGVHWHRDGRKWQARIHVDGKQRHLGYFDIEEDAARAYDKAALKLHGEFARLNIPTEVNQIIKEATSELR